ncbi:MAG: aspartyl/asparaginyl beta-hydroxylase domain-containing protein [Gammaproteobacteria bacterium]|nr:aspartyl/asparaginyl beta-hydroxylase domain-containing protein [Gammaproteobacteria bacterium]MDE2108761.1 aspartyl/asparaginyl beta-hydroxylase domain-containing protein [Gammaproteobacteria bacterium]MDE2460764.1 aspartyl/asparaginyl beta-hydroxylase domain-containing protein [Gammaproteobacteria bacterium]
MPPATPNPARQISILADSAQQLAQRGELSEAEKIYRTILETAPYHVRALQFLAVRAFERGQLDESQRLVEQALRSDPKRPILYQNLGLIHNAKGNPELALAALNQALALRPEFFTALLHKAALLERLGQDEEALASYRLAWRCLPQPPETLAKDPSIPPKVCELITHAAEYLRARQAAELAARLLPLQDKHGEAALAAVRSAAAVFMGTAQPQYAHAMQRPAYLYLPGIEPRAFFDRADFPWLATLEQATAAIRAELDSVLQNQEGLKPYVQIDAVQDPREWRELNQSPQWSAFQLLKGGKPILPNAECCPATMQALQALPLVRIPGHAPEAFFSVLRPGTHIPPHYGLANYKLAVHLPLIVPADCAIRVGNETRGWTEGQCLIFDDSFQHEAWNKSDRLRAVLITEVWNPLLTEVEREGIAALVAGISTLNQGQKTSHGAY